MKLVSFQSMDAFKQLIEKGYLIKTPHKQIKEYYLFYESGTDDEI